MADRPTCPLCREPIPAGRGRRHDGELHHAHCAAYLRNKADVLEGRTYAGTPAPRVVKRRDPRGKYH